MILDDEAFEFAQSCRKLVRDLPDTAANEQDGIQLIRASGALATSAIDYQNESDDEARLSHCRLMIRHTKKCILWLKLLECGKDSERNALRDKLLSQAQSFSELITKKTDAT